LNGCTVVPEWSTINAAGDQFNPLIKHNGLLGPNSQWRVSYSSRQRDPNGSSVANYAGNFAILTTGALFVPTRITEDLEVCSDERGYWGDYDDLALLDANSSSGATSYIRAHTDSSVGCTAREQYTSTEVHVSAVVF